MSVISFSDGFVKINAVQLLFHYWPQLHPSNTMGHQLEMQCGMLPTKKCVCNKEHKLLWTCLIQNFLPETVVYYFTTHFFNDMSILEMLYRLCEAIEKVCYRTSINAPIIKVVFIDATTKIN